MPSVLRVVDSAVAEAGIHADAPDDGAVAEPEALGSRLAGNTVILGRAGRKTGSDPRGLGRAGRQRRHDRGEGQTHGS
jgi:hypothetical protein